MHYVHFYVIIFEMLNMLLATFFSYKHSEQNFKGVFFN